MTEPNSIDAMVGHLMAEVMALKVRVEALEGPRLVVSRPAQREGVQTQGEPRAPQEVQP